MKNLKIDMTTIEDLKRHYPHILEALLQDIKEGIEEGNEIEIEQRYYTDVDFTKQEVVPIYRIKSEEDLSAFKEKFDI